MVQGSQCYFVNATAQVTWHQAVTKCVALNATLAKVTSQDEAEFLGRKCACAIQGRGLEHSKCGMSRVIVQVGLT